MSGAHSIVTEASNEITKSIDVSDARGIVRLLRQCDAQMYAGFGDNIGIFDSPFLDHFEALISSLSSSIKILKSGEKPSIRVVMAGAGTSGRLAFYLARNFNEAAQKMNANIEFSYLMAGKDIALLKSQEKAEDDVEESVREIQTISSERNFDRVVYIGITCGFSAPYVGSQLNWILNDSKSDKFTAVLMGFNDVSVARNRPVEKWNKTVFEVVSQLLSKIGDGRHFILNPILGPEPITGSSRMKGGTATKILLETLFALSLSRSLGAPIAPDLASSKPLTSAADVLAQFESVARYTYFAEESLGKLVDAAGKALLNGGHLYYLAEDPFSLLGVTDASECPPTYGSLFSDVRGYVIGGWKTMRNVEGDLSEVSPWYRIGDEHFIADVVPHLTENDLIVVFFSKSVSSKTSSLVNLVQAALKSSPKTKFGSVSYGERSADIESALKSSSPIRVDIRLRSEFILPGVSSFLELSVKYVLNAVSTGAHVLKGKIFGNLMIDLSISNNKLYYRGIEIIQKLLGISADVATDAILKSIYLVDKVTDEIKANPISVHYATAITTSKVIPRAVLLACGRCSTIAEAQALLAAEPVLRKVIGELVKK